METTGFVWGPPTEDNAAEYLRRQGWKIVDWGIQASFSSPWWWDGKDRHYIHDWQTAYYMARNDQAQREFEQSRQLYQQLPLFT